MKYKTGPIEGVETIEEAIEKIDFEAIVKAMRFLGWQHCFKDVTIEGLKETVMELYGNLEDTPMNGETFCASGGFKVVKTVYDDAPKMYGVYFTISQSIIVGTSEEA